MPDQIIVQTTFSQRVAFAEPPGPAMRRALLAAGFTYNGSYWSLTRGTASAIHPRDLADILATMMPDSASA